MIRNRIVKNYLEYARVHKFEEKASRRIQKEQMRTDAIRGNGIYKTFCFSEKCYDITLNYIKIEDKDIELYTDMFEKEFAAKRIPSGKTDPDTEYKDILGSCLMYNQTGEIDDKLQHVLEGIKEECAKKFNAVYSTVEIDNIYAYKLSEAIFIHYSYYSIKNKFIDKISSYDAVFGIDPLPYAEWFTSKIHPIDNLSPDPADESRKENVESIALSKDVYNALKDKGVYAWCHTSIFPERNTDYSENTLKELKENKNMKMHLLIVPAGMNEEFVNNTKKSLQSSNSNIMYVSSNDIAFEPNDKYKTKYDLIEYWIDSNMIHAVEFMVGYENDPEAKALEAYIRGTNSAAMKRVILMYQKDNIENVIDNLRDNYDESSRVTDRLHDITDSIMDKVNFFKEFGLEQADLDKIRNANCDKDACFAAVLKMTDIAFASDNKKGNKKK